MSVTFLGPIETPGAVGQGGYAIAIGYDPGDGNVKMIGYCLAPGSTYQEGDNLQDEQHLVQIASPGSTDRYARYPQVSQGDWTHGMRQQIFVDGAAFYTSQGFDTTSPGLLKPSPSPLVISDQMANGKAFPTVACATDGSNWIISRENLVGGTNCIVGGPMKPLGEITIMNAGSGVPTIFDLIRIPLGVFAGTDAGIFFVQFNNLTGSQLWTSDQILNPNNMAYFDGSLYYIKTDGSVASVTAVSTPGSTIAVPNMENHFVAICSTANGLFLATGLHNQGGTEPTDVSVLYTYDGTNLTRIGTLEGSIYSCVTLNGVTYILTVLDQPFGEGNYTLFSLTGSTISVVDDLRYAAPQFQVSPNVNPVGNGFQGSLKEDGRYLYIGWQGLPGLRYDPVLDAFSTVGAPAYLDPAPASRVIFPTTVSGIIDIYFTYTSGGIQNILSYSGPPTSGTLIESYFDYATPGINKLFLGLTAEFAAPQNPDSLVVFYRVDNQVNFISAPVRADVGTGLRAYLPPNTIGQKIQFQIGYNAANFFPNVPWEINTISSRGELARVWTLTVSCRQQQITHNGTPDQQGMNGYQLLANLLNARRLAAGDVYLYVADPTDPNGDGSYSTTVFAKIEQMTRTTTDENPGAHSPDGLAFGMEGDYQLVLTEQSQGTF